MSNNKPTEKKKKETMKEKTLKEAKDLILEMRKKNEDWYIRKVIGKARHLLTGAKKGKNVSL